MSLEHSGVPLEDVVNVRIGSNADVRGPCTKRDPSRNQMVRLGAGLQQTEYGLSTFGIACRGLPPRCVRLTLERVWNLATARTLFDCLEAVLREGREYRTTSARHPASRVWQRGRRSPRTRSFAFSNAYRHSNAHPDHDSSNAAFDRDLR